MSHLMEAFYSYTEKSQFFNAKGINSLLSMWYYIAKKLNTQFSYDNFSKTYLFSTPSAASSLYVFQLDSFLG